MQKNRKKVIVGLLAVVVVIGIALSLPPVWSRASYYAREAYTSVKYFLFPPQESVFVPEGSNSGFVPTSVAATLSAYYPTATAVPPTPTMSAPAATVLPTLTPTPMPPYAYLSGVVPEPQLWNNCGPATLSMNLSYYGWKKKQTDTAAVLKPNDRDKNVMPYEMVNYVNDYTSWRALSRMGGDIQTLKALVNSGFPVLIEKGFEPPNLKRDGWMGHFNLVIGYDDAKGVLITQDSYLLNHQTDTDSIPGFDVTYADMVKNWRAFNYVFLVVYPPDKENDVLNALGPLADDNSAYRVAYDRAMAETDSLLDVRDQFFAWFNAGTSLVYLQDYATASAMYDKAFDVYPGIAETSRPWRMLWYQTGPYFAYYYSGRFQDVINLVTLTLKDMSEPILEESFYWRGLSYLALGDRKSAIQDFQESVRVHPGFAPSMGQLQQLGEMP